jgi:hypothetical protein
VSSGAVSSPSAVQLAPSAAGGDGGLLERKTREIPRRPTQPIAGAAPLSSAPEALREASTLTAAVPIEEVSGDTAPLAELSSCQVTSPVGITSGETQAEREPTAAVSVELLGASLVTPVSHTAPTKPLQRHAPAVEVPAAPSASATPAAAIGTAGGSMAPRPGRWIWLLPLCVIGGLALGLVAGKLRRVAAAPTTQHAVLRETVRRGDWSLRVDAVQLFRLPQGRLQLVVHLEAPASARPSPGLLQISDGQRLLPPSFMARSDAPHEPWRLVYNVTRDLAPLRLMFAPPGERPLVVVLERP